MQNTSEKPALVSVFNPKWYIEQMKGWSTRSYFLLAIGISFIIGTTVANPITGLALWTMAAAILGFTTTLSITNTRPLNGVFGMVSALIYIVIAIHAKNPGDAILQGVYILFLDLPVLIMPGWAQNVNQRVRKIKETGIRGEKHSPAFWYTMTALLFVVAAVSLYFFEIYVTHSPRPIIDSITAAIGITGAFLTTQRFSESYIFWLLQGLAQVILWGATAMQGDASMVLFFTYILYIANDLVAFTDKDVAWFHHQAITDKIASNH